VPGIAAELGVPDFVFHSPSAAKGQGATREVSGDGLLISGDIGAVLQVKARDPDLVALDNPQGV
jgi:hypothetical protein